MEAKFICFHITAIMAVSFYSEIEDRPDIEVKAMPTFRAMKEPDDADIRFDAWSTGKLAILIDACMRNLMMMGLHSGCALLDFAVSSG